MLLIIALLLSSFSLFSAETGPELERLNFFPRSAAFLNVEYDHTVTRIEAKDPSTSLQTVREYSNALRSAYAQRLSPSVFLGVSLMYESVRESSLRYGIDNEDRNRSKGLINPGVFTNIRAREQNAEHGIIDIGLLFRPNTGTRRIGGDDSNRKLGRSLFVTQLSHGLKEEEWEFKTSVTFSFQGEGRERNLLLDQEYELSSYNNYQFMFESQYAFPSNVFLHGGAGFIYHGDEKIGESDDRREIQIGTESIFYLGFKYIISERILVHVRYTLINSDYFVQSSDGNFDGARQMQNLKLGFVTAFN